MKRDFLKKLEFDEEYINKCNSAVSNDLKEYIRNNITPEYMLNDGGHNIEHINYVLKRAFEISSGYEINYDILYTCVMFHDIACHIDRDNHEILSAERAYNDEFLKNKFSETELVIIKDAIEDHRASSDYEPRNIYGKILSSADRKVEVKVYLKSSISFAINKNPEMSKEDIIIGSYEFAIKKFGISGYAIDKSFVDDNKYKQFLEDLQFLIKNKDLYFENASIIYDEIK